MAGMHWMDAIRIRLPTSCGASACMTVPGASGQSSERFVTCQAPAPGVKRMRKLTFKRSWTWRRLERIPPERFESSLAWLSIALSWLAVHEAPQHSFGKDLIGQTWELEPTSER